MLKKLLLPWLAVATLSASTITATFVGTTTGVTVDRTISNSTTGPQTATTLYASLLEFKLSTGETVYTYCLEPQQTAASGTFGIDPSLLSAPGNVGGMSTAQAAAVRLVLGQVANPFDPSLSAVDQAAIQIALWEIVRENVSSTYNINTGNVTASNASLAGVIGRTQAILNAVNAGHGTPYSGAVAWTNSSVQDMVAAGPIAVPEPASLALVGIGLILVGGGAFRRRNN